MSANEILSEDTKYARFLFYFVVLYAAIMIAHDFARLWGFGFGIDDIGIYHQVIWNTANGDWFQTSIKYPYLENSNWLGFHFAILPIILALPFYKIYPALEVLTPLHVVLVSSTAFIIYKICRKFELKGRTAFLWSVIYLINPITIFHAMFSYQETSISVFLTALAIYFVVSKNYRWLIVTCFLLLIDKEHHGTTVFGLGLLWGWYNKSWRGALFLCALGTITFFLIIFVIMPELSPYKQHFMLATDKVLMSSSYDRYQWLRGSFDQILEKAPEVIFSSDNITLVLSVVCLFALMPLFSLFFLFPVAGEFLLIILSNSSIPKQMNLYYSAPFIAPLVIAAAFTLRKFSLTMPKVSRWIMANIIFLTLVGASQPLYLTISKINFISKNQINWSIDKDFQEVISKIPVDKVLMTDQATGYLLSGRRNIKLYDSSQINKADYTLLKVSGFDFSPASKMQNTYSLAVATQLMQSKNWGIIYWKYPYVIYMRDAKTNPEVDINDYISVMSQLSALDELFKRSQ